MIVLQQQGLLLQSETNLIGESLLVLGSAAGGEQQSLVLEWLLGPLRQQWLQPEWQEHFLSSPGGLVQLLTQKPGVPVDQNTREPESEHNGQMWSVYHTITFFERALRRCTPPPSGKTLTTQPVSSDTLNVDMDGSITATAGHPMVAHLAWILPPLLKVRSLCVACRAPIIPIAVERILSPCLLVSPVAGCTISIRLF
jgi:exportin-5